MTSSKRGKTPAREQSNGTTVKSRKGASKAGAFKVVERPKKVASKKRTPATAERWELRLYVAGKTPLSIEAFANLERICEEHLHGRYRIEVVDLLVNPALARGDQILAVPTLVRQLPPPMKKIIGDFSNWERVLVGLNIRPLKAAQGGK